MEEYIDIIMLINEKYNDLSKGQKLIAKYIINNYDKAAFMTAAKLGESIGVSESTVVRFAIAIGFEGYKELQIELQDLVKTKLTTVQRISLSQEYNELDDIINFSFKKDIDNIEKTIANLNYADFKKAIDMTLKARKVYILGMRSSFFLAGYLSFYLNYLLDDVRVIKTEGNDVFEQLLNVDENDLVIVISYPRYARATLKLLDHLRVKKAKIISITDSFSSPVSDHADVTLIANSDMISFIDSIVGAMSLINAFIAALGYERKEEITDKFDELEDIWNKYDIYVKNINDQS